jgi:hypothetical protein
MSIEIDENTALKKAEPSLIQVMNMSMQMIQFVLIVNLIRMNWKGVFDIH